MKKRISIRYRLFWLSTLGTFLLLITLAAREQPPDPPPAVGEWETDPQVWERHAPEQYERWMLGSSAVETPFGGGRQRSKLEENPRLRILYAGAPYAQDYNEDRGHTWSMEDLRRTERFGKGKPATCMTCKSSAVPRFVAEMGTDKFENARLSDFAQPEAKQSIGCINCHDPKSLRLRFYVPAMREALISRKADPEMVSDSDMHVYVCAQCHSDYYFQTEGDKTSLRFGWRAGTRFEDWEQYYDQIDYADWTHPDTRAQLVKVQHPEYELWSSSLHARRGVSCTACHMPIQKTVDRDQQAPLRITDHWVRSPLGNLEKVCKRCHQAYSTGDLESEVLAIQKRTRQLLDRAEIALTDAIRAIKDARQAGVSDEELEFARECHRKAHLRWDFISSENSMGAHSPQESARLLGEAIDYARSGQLDALQALHRHQKTKKSSEK